MKIEQFGALLIIDPQNDFMPGGSLAVPDGDAIIPIINPLTHKVPLVVVSQDWHPPDHMSFKNNGGPWPPHCVQGTSGADFHPDLDQSHVELVVRTGFEREDEGYSCFYQNGLAAMLKSRDIERLLITGLATDYCVLRSTLGALEGGLKISILEEGVRGVGVHNNDIENAFKEMTAAGAEIINCRDLE